MKRSFYINVHYISPIFVRQRNAPSTVGAAREFRCTELYMYGYENKYDTEAYADVGIILNSNIVRDCINVSQSKYDKMF